MIPARMKAAAATRPPASSCASKGEAKSEPTGCAKGSEPKDPQLESLRGGESDARSRGRSHKRRKQKSSFRKSDRRRSRSTRRRKSSRSSEVSLTSVAGSSNDPDDDSSSPSRQRGSASRKRSAEEANSKHKEADHAEEEANSKHKEADNAEEGAEEGADEGAEDAEDAEDAEAGATFKRTEDEAADAGPMMYDSMTQKQISDALKLRKEYRTPGGKQFLPPCLVGFDPENRDGIPCNGTRCDKLLGDICRMGFDEDEANFENICVQARPNDASSPEGLYRVNKEACEASPMLADLNVDSLSYGSLSHSHLHQCLKNINGGAVAQRPAAFCTDGKLSLEIVATRDPDLARACTQGLKWEILHWKIRDHPDAMRIIQGACNRKGASQMRETEVQTVARLAQITTKLSRASGDGRVTYATARWTLAATMPDQAESAEFLGLLRYVVTLGGDAAPFISDLKKFVGIRGEGRQVRAQLFSEASKLPATIPHLMVAVIVAAFTAPEVFFCDGYSRFITSSDIRSLLQGDPPKATPVAQQGESILKYFHIACKDASVYTKTKDCQRLDFLSRVDSLVIRMLMEKPLGTYSERAPSMLHLAEVLFIECEKLFKRPMPAKVWGKPEAEATPRSSTAPAGKNKPDLEPRLIQYNEKGEATNTQDTFEATRSYSSCDWKGTLASSTLELDLHKSLLMKALSLVNDALLEMNPPSIDIRRWSSGELQVVATAEIPAQGISFAPMITGTGFLALKSKRGGLPPGAVTLHGYGPTGTGGEVDDMAILPCLRMPPRGVDMEDHKAAQKPLFLHPFWAIERHAQADKCNCDLIEVSVDMVLNAGFGNLQLPAPTRSMMQSLRIPVMTNTKVTD